MKLLRIKIINYETINLNRIMIRDKIVILFTILNKIKKVHSVFFFIRQGHEKLKTKIAFQI